MSHTLPSSKVRETTDWPTTAEGKLVPTIVIISPPAGLKPVVGDTEVTVGFTVAGVREALTGIRPFASLTAGFQEPPNRGVASVQSTVVAVFDVITQSVCPMVTETSVVGRLEPVMLTARPLTVMVSMTPVGTS